MTKLTLHGVCIFILGLGIFACGPHNTDSGLVDTTTELKTRLQSLDRNTCTTDTSLTDHCSVTIKTDPVVSRLFVSGQTYGNCAPFLGNYNCASDGSMKCISDTSQNGTMSTRNEASVLPNRQIQMTQIIFNNQTNVISSEESISLSCD